MAEKKKKRTKKIREMPSVDADICAFDRFSAARKSKRREQQQRKKRRLHDSLNERPRGDIDVSGEEEKRSLLAWVESSLYERSHVVGSEGDTFVRHSSLDTALKNVSAFQADSCCDLTKIGGDAPSEMVQSIENSLSEKQSGDSDKVLQYLMKRSLVVKPLISNAPKSCIRTCHTVVHAWGKDLPVTLTNDALVIQQWIEKQCGSLFGLDVEWKPNRVKGKTNKVALLQLCGDQECLIVQMLTLNQKPVALVDLLFDPKKSLAGVGVDADARRLLKDYGLICRGRLELTALAVDRLKRQELNRVGLKVLVKEVLGIQMEKPKGITLSNWAKLKLNRAQIRYACIDAWASFAVSQKLLEHA